MIPRAITETYEENKEKELFIYRIEKGEKGAFKMFKIPCIINLINETLVATISSDNSQEALSKEDTKNFIAEWCDETIKSYLTNTEGLYCIPLVYKDVELLFVETYQVGNEVGLDTYVYGYKKFVDDYTEKAERFFSKLSGRNL